MNQLFPVEGLMSVAAAWKPFLTTMPVWNYWYLLALPLCLGVAIVYKTTKCAEPAGVPKEAAILFVWIVAGMIGVAFAVEIVTLLN